MKHINDYIINHFDDQDVYKFFMHNFLWEQGYLDYEVEWKLYNRGKVKFPEGFAEHLRYQIDHMRDVKLEKEFLDYLSTKFPFLQTYALFLADYHYKPETVIITQIGEDVDIVITGKYGDVIFWECQIMAMMSELYNFMKGNQDIYDNNLYLINKNDVNKFRDFHILGAKIIEFGMRRRFSFENQCRVLHYAKEYITGTSNVYFARTIGIPCYGTMAHELTMFFAALYGVKDANRILMDKWIEVYRGKLATCLPDTFTTEVFLKDFDLYYAKLFDGTRQDSGEPEVFAEKIIEHYKKIGINPKHKNIGFSDSINKFSIVDNLFCKYTQIFNMVWFGIGTWITNDIPTVTPVNWVIKMTKVKLPGLMPGEGEWKYTAKLSDTPGKITTIDMDTANEYKQILKINYGNN